MNPVDLTVRALRSLQGSLLKLGFRRSGKNLKVCHGCSFSYSSIIVGNDVFIGPKCSFQSAHGTILIGDRVMFGPEVMIIGGDHKHRQGKAIRHITKNHGDDGTISIGSDCWIGARAILLKDVSIGDAVIIGAGSIVNFDLPSNHIYVGTPLRYKLIER
jgi:acetyltransferase-like isoleucine patch superfamily enzyme